MASIILGKLFGKTIRITVNPTNTNDADIELNLDAGNSGSLNLTTTAQTVSSATADNTPDTLVTRDANGDFSGQTITAQSLISSSLTANKALYANAL